METPLLTTKQRIPIIRSDLIARPRLQKMLNEGLRRKLTLISAPAGFGKTTLAATWAQDLALATGWVSLDHRDNDPVVFFSYLFKAIKVVPQPGEPFLEYIQAPESAILSVFLTEWINAVAQLSSHAVLLLDDFHLIENPSIHKAVSFLLENLPYNLHIYLITRSDPPIPLARLRGLGQMVEIREADLRFTPEEALDFFHKSLGITLDHSELSALQNRTEGWAVGMQLAGLALQGREDLKGFISSFSGEHHFIIDYLTEEVFNYQPEDVKTFLVRTCILKRMCAGLCDAVTGESNGETMLSMLDQRNLFIFSLDDERQWYRYHQLFADLLSKRLIQASPEIIPSLHLRASAWFEQHGATADAIEHTLAAKDYERAASLIEANIEAVLMRSEITTLIQWMDQLPDEWVRKGKNLCYYHAWVLIAGGSKLERIEQRLQDLNCLKEPNGQGSEMAGRMTALDAYRALLQGDLNRAGILSHQALQKLSKKDRFISNIMTWIENLASLQDSDFQGNQQTLSNIARMGITLGNPLIAVTAICYQAKLQMRQGHLSQARQTLERALQVATDSNGQRLPIASEPLVLLGDLEREWNNLEIAEKHLSDSIELAKQWNKLSSFEAYFPLARIKLAQGDLWAANQFIESSIHIALQSETTDLDDTIAEFQQAYFWVRQGEAAKASLWVEKRGLVQDAVENFGLTEHQVDIQAHLRKYELLVLAQLYLQQNQPAEALDLLTALLAYVRKLNRVDLVMQCQILRALAYQLEQETDLALEALAEAFSLAEPGGYMRIFLDEGDQLTELLRQAAARNIHPDYASKLLAATSQSSTRPTAIIRTPATPQPLIEPISDRELDVLRLMATGKSNPEIAEALVIAVSTVRSHCKSLYGKLGVHRRWDAVQRGRELGFIE